MTRIRFGPLLLCVLFALPAGAQTLYKLIDKNGKVTYSETPPKNFDGKVIRIDIDPNANTAVLPKPATAEGASGEVRSKDAEALRRGVQRSASIDEKIDQARKNVEDAKQRLKDLEDNPGDNDVMRRGNVGGGTRPVFTDEYLQRIERAKAEVKTAEEELARMLAER